MIVKDQLKILDNKIRQNQADHDLYGKNDKISALSSGKLDKYEYLTGEDLGYRPDPVQKAKFESNPLRQVLNKELTTDEKSESLLKRLKNIEDKTDNQLRALENDIGNQPSAIKNGIINQLLCQLMIEKLVIQKNLSLEMQMVMIPSTEKTLKDLRSDAKILYING